MQNKGNEAVTGQAASGRIPPEESNADLHFLKTWKTDFSKHTVPLSEASFGGPPKDGIPAIDSPKFESVQDADKWLKDTEPLDYITIN